MASAPVISKDSPVFEACDGVLDASPSTTMHPPGTISHDAVLAEARRSQLGDSAVPAIGQDTTMCLAEALDRGASIVNDVIPIPWTAGDGCDHGEVASTNQDLRIARPSIVLRLGRVAVIACRDQGSVHHPREPSIRRLARKSCGVTAAMIRWTVDFEMRVTAASSRTVRLVRSAMQVSRTRCSSDHAGRRPRDLTNGRRLTS